MQKLWLILAAICAAWLSGAPALASASSAEQAIRPVMAKMLVAANAHDTDAFMAPMLRRPSLVFAINGEVIRGWDALHAQQLKWWKNGKSDAKYAQDGAALFMALGSNVEVVTWSLPSSRVLADRKTATSAFVVTYVWQRLPEGWRIVYGHESWKKPPG